MDRLVAARQLAGLIVAVAVPFQCGVPEQEVGGVWRVRPRGVRDRIRDPRPQQALAPEGGVRQAVGDLGHAGPDVDPEGPVGGRHVAAVGAVAGAEMVVRRGEVPVGGAEEAVGGRDLLHSDPIAPVLPLGHDRYR